MPGEETFKCYFTSLPVDDTVAVTKFESTLAPGSHHMILFISDAPLHPDGTFGDCDAEFGGMSVLTNLPLPLYLTQDAQSSVEMPPGVAMPLKRRQPMMFQMHYLNATSQPLTASVKMRATWTTGDFERAGPFASYSTQIAVPPHGTQTVSGHCAVPDSSQFFRMTTHAHKHMTDAQVARWNQQPGDMILENTDWEHPKTEAYDAPYLTLAPGEEIYYQCTYRNDGDTVIHDGQSAATNEMCMAIGYYFPASRTTVCIDSMSITL